jgi:hypothetical protein
MLYSTDLCPSQQPAPRNRSFKLARWVQVHTKGPCVQISSWRKSKIASPLSGTCISLFRRGSLALFLWLMLSTFCETPCKCPQFCHHIFIPVCWNVHPHLFHNISAWPHRSCKLSNRQGWEKRDWGRDWVDKYISSHQKIRQIHASTFWVVSIQTNDQISWNIPAKRTSSTITDFRPAWCAKSSTSFASSSASHPQSS